MTQLTQILLAPIILGIGFLLGYYVRRLLVKKGIGSIEQRYQERISQAKAESKRILEEAKEKVEKASLKLRQDYDKKRRELLKTLQLLL